MQFCITLDIFARRTPKNEFLPPVMVSLLVSIYFMHSVNISRPPVLYFENCGGCFLGRCT